MRGKTLSKKMTTSEFPPEGEQFGGGDTVWIPSGEKPDGKCQAQLTMVSTGGADPGIPGVGPSEICWNPAGPTAPIPSELTSGTCNPNSGCSAKLVMGLNIQPTDPNHDPKEHYEYWHGKGSYGPPRVPTKKPSWTQKRSHKTRGQN